MSLLYPVESTHLVRISALLFVSPFNFLFFTSVVLRDQKLAKFYSEMFVIWGEGWGVPLRVQKNFQMGITVKGVFRCLAINNS